MVVWLLVLLMAGQGLCGHGTLRGGPYGKKGGSRSNPPNIVFILADDMGFNDVSWNNGDVIMPNLQSLAERGVILNQSYVQALCSPSRAAYLTGMYPYHIGFQEGVVRNGVEHVLPLDLTLLPEKLKERGYSTHLVGKWHLGHCRVDATPTLRGFDSFFGTYSAIIDYFTKKLPREPVPGLNISLPDAYDLRDDLDVYYSPADQYVTDIFTQRAVQIISKHDANTPLYLSLQYTTPHAPLQVPEKYLAIYPNVSDPYRQRYLAMVTAMDEGVGKVIRALRYKGIYDNTIIVFTSDNGGLPGLGGASNTPLRDIKGSYYEGGVRSPTFVHSPNHVKQPGRISEDLFHIVDWFPTLLSAAGDKVPLGDGNLDGVDQWSMLSTGSPGQRYEMVYTIVEGRVAAIRQGRYKLIEGNADSIIPDTRTPPPTFPGGHVTCSPPSVCDCQLYDLQADPGETTDLACAKPALVRQLFRRLTELKASEVPPVLPFPTVYIPASAPELNNGTVAYGWC